ncbi:MAG: hypothetical protein QM754_07840 [Tepidisphaeraceae bacterium]
MYGLRDGMWESRISQAEGNKYLKQSGYKRYYLLLGFDGQSLVLSTDSWPLGNSADEIGARNANISLALPASKYPEVLAAYNSVMKHAEELPKEEVAQSWDGGKAIRITEIHGGKTRMVSLLINPQATSNAFEKYEKFRGGLQQAYRLILDRSKILDREPRNFQEIQE